MSRLRELLTELRDAPNENILWDLVKKSGRIEALLAAESDASAPDWQRRYAEETRIVDEVWAALGISTYEQAQGKDIATLVRELKAYVDAQASAPLPAPLVECSNPDFSGNRCRNCGLGNEAHIPTRSRETAELPMFTKVEVLGHEGKPVAAPCAISGCQYGAALAVEARRSAELEPYLQHTQDCQMTTEGHIAAIVSRGDGTVTCTCGLDALRRPSGTGGET